MGFCLFINIDGTVSEISMDKNELPNITDEVDPMPYVMNIFYPRNSIKWMKLMNTIHLQHSKIYNNPSIRIVFAAPSTWSLEGIEEIGVKKINKLATFLCKYHEVFGPALLFNIDMKDISKSDFDSIYESAKHIKHDEKKDKSFNASDIEGKISEISEKSILTQDDRELILKYYIDDMCVKRNIMSLELMYMIIAPQIYYQYVLRNRYYVNSIPSYALSEHMHDAYFFITFEKGSIPGYGEHYLYLKGKVLPMIVPDNFDQCIEIMTNIMKKVGLKYTPPVYKKREYSEYERKLDEVQEEKDRKRTEIFMEKQRELNERQQKNMRRREN